MDNEKITAYMAKNLHMARSDRRVLAGLALVSEILIDLAFDEFCAPQPELDFDTFVTLNTCAAGVLA